MRNYCRYCGFKLAENKEKCPRCGRNLSVPQAKTLNASVPPIKEKTVFSDGYYDIDRYSDHQDEGKMDGFFETPGDL